MNRAVSLSRRSRGGMSLIEVIFALTIFSTIAAGMAYLFVQSRDLADRARDHYVAVNLAKNRLERAMSYTVTNISGLVESQTPVDVSGEDSDDAQPGYRRTTEVRYAATNLVEVTVTVDIYNRSALDFTGEKEVLRSYFTDY